MLAYVKGTSQLPNPPIKIGMTKKKLLQKLGCSNMFGQTSIA